MLLFVYGTLMEGECYHHYLARSTPHGEALTDVGFVLLNTGEYPALVRASKGQVKGELYQVDPLVLHAADELEECPTLYERIDIRLADGRRAMTYLFVPTPDPHWPAIESGDWRVR